MKIGEHPFPDFFVIGAQKSGTTSLCAWLDQHPKIAFSKPKEPMLISRDEASLHPHFFAEQPHSWEQFHWPEALYRYDHYFKDAPEGALLADGSTSYLYSQLAPARIAELAPKAKIIVILRDPVARCYSAYQHYLRQGTACEGFEKHLQFEGGLTVQGSEYAGHIKRWLAHFPRERFHFLLYEELKADREAAEKALLAFLELEPHSLGLLPKENTARSVRSEKLQLFLNRKIRHSGGKKQAAIENDKIKQTTSGLEWLRRLNLSDAPYPPMELNLRRRLNRHFRAMNAELEALTGLHVSNKWYVD